MQFGPLKVFCDVARHRSFSQAAHANEITQSAVSQIVSQLERSMEVQLVDRSTRPLQLTPMGQKYFRGCESLLEQYRELESAVRRAQSQVGGVVHLAAIYSVRLGDLSKYIDRFVSQYPEVEFEECYLHPDQVYERVLAGTVDLGLVSFPKAHPKLISTLWRDEEMLVTCSPSHPLAAKAVLRASDLNGQKLAHFDTGLTIRRKIDQFLRSIGVAPIQVGVAYDNVEYIKKAVQDRKLIALLPAPTLIDELKAGTLVARPIAGKRFFRPLGIIHRRSGFMSRAALRFKQLLLEPASDNGTSHTKKKKPSEKSRA